MKKHTHGGDVYRYQNCIDFSANCNPLGTPDGVKKAIIESVDHLADYPQVGSLILKEKIAEYEQIPEEQIICGNGAAEVIFSLCRALNPKRALIPVPTFAEYEQALRSVGCEINYFYLNEKLNFRLDDDFLDVINEKVDIIFLCNPNNPTGISIRQELLLNILNRCVLHGIFLVVDECFLDFIKNPMDHSLKLLLSQYPNLFLLKAFTKRYAIPGVRLGYGLCSNMLLLQKMEQMTQPWNVSSIAQAAGIAALNETAYVEKGREIVFQESEFLKKNMRDLGLKVFDSEANYIFFYGPDHLFEECLKEKVLIRDCSNYPGLKKGYYRIAVKQHDYNEKFIQVLIRIMKGKEE